MKKVIIVAVLALAALGLVLFGGLNTSKKIGLNPTPSQSPQTQTSSISTVAQNLEIPWSLAFLPNGDILVTERPGKVKLVEKNGNVKLVAELPNVKHIGEGGLMGIVLDPNFSSSGYVYLYYTYGGETLNRVVRMTYKNGKLENEQIIVDKIPGASNHNGGRIKFGPDGLLYIATGDSQNPSLAQDKNSLAGKILRVNNVGKVEVYSYGHRNVQGLAWDSNGNLWATEHGPSGGQLGTGNDELNKIEAGKNYGWPTIQGDQEKSGMATPVINSTPSVAWAPAGAAFLDGSIFFVGLRGSALYEYKIGEQKLVEHFKDGYGRLRDVVLDPDGFLYITTSNRDGRGNPADNDDKIIRIDPKSLK